MPSLKDYVKDGLKKGYSKNELTETLLEKGYSKKEIESLFDEPKKEIKDNIQENKVDLNMFQKIGLLFSNPNKFFSSVRDTHIGYSIGMYVSCAIFVAALGIFLSVILFSSMLDDWVPGILGASIGLFLLIFSFVYAAIVHGWVKIFGGKGSYVDTFNALIYSAVPGILITIIPMIGLLGSLYSIVLSVIGLSKYHEMSIGKAIGVVILSIMILIVIIAAFFFWLLSQMF